MTRLIRSSAYGSLARIGFPDDPRPMVLHVRVVAGTGGGPDKTILRSARYYRQSALRMAAAYIHPADDSGIDMLHRQAADMGCPFYPIAERGPLDGRTVSSLLELCRKLNVRVWHGHDYKSNFLGLLIRRWHRMRLVTTVHGWTWDTWRSRLYHHIDNACIARYERVLAVSPKLYDHCLSHRVPKERLVYLPNGIELEEYPFTLDRDASRQMLGIHPGSLPHIGVVGRLSREKGVDRAVAAAARLRQIMPRVQLHLVGDGPDHAYLQTLIHRHAMMPNVHFHGWQKDAKRFYPAMDLLLLPSRTEGMPNALLEAMAMGTPVAATDVGGVRELLADGQCGEILPDDEYQWPQRLSALLHDRMGMLAMAHRARQRVQQHYAFDFRMKLELAIQSRMLGLDQAGLQPDQRRVA